MHVASPGFLQHARGPIRTAVHAQTTQILYGSGAAPRRTQICSTATARPPWIDAA
jgi:hypothetical protein